MALSARVAKLGSGAYGARHARVRPSVMQCVLAVRATVVKKPSRLNIVAQGLSNSLPVPSLSPCTHFFQREREREREGAQHLHLTHTSSFGLSYYEGR